MRNKFPTESEQAAASAEAEDFAAGVFARMSAVGIRARTRSSKRGARNNLKPGTDIVQQQPSWFSGVEAALPNGDRE